MSQEPLLESLKRLAAGQILPDDISKLQQALSSKQITYSAGGIAIGGNVSGGVVGNFVLPADVLKMLHPAYQLPSSPPKGTLAERGPLPPGFRMPFLPNAVFTGRQEYLTDLADILLHPGQDGAADTGVVVTGIGGVGKSQLAVEFCYRYGRFFQGVHWIQANLNISAEVVECGLAMGLPGWPDKLPEQVAATIRAWQEGGRRLIVLDNAEDLRLVQEWMPKLQPCRLLITSRRDNWPADLGIQTKRLDELTRIQSIELLRKLAPRLQKVADDELGELANYLGDLPLALDLAGRYLKERTELSIKGYLEELEAAGNALEHTSLKNWVEHNPTNHSTSLAATFALSWDQLGEADDLANLLFRTGGYCAPNTPIPRGLLAKAIEGKGSDQELDRALRKLESLGLMQPTEGGHRMHTLLAEFARLQDKDAKESALPALAGAMVGFTTHALESRLPGRMGPLKEHLEVVALAAEGAGVKSAGPLWSNYGMYLLRNLADLCGAKMSLTRALSIDEKVFGPDHPNVAIDVNNLGGVLQALGELQESRECFERALKIDEKVFGPDHPRVAIRVSNLSGVLRDQGKLQEAKNYSERALLIDEKVYGSVHPNVAIDVNNLGMVLKEMGKLQEAKNCYKRGLKIDTKAYGPDHPNIAIRLNNLSMILRDMGKLQKARKYIVRALMIDDKTYGPDHLEVARDVNNLGTILQALGKLQEARKCYERALEICRQKLGEDHPTTKMILKNLELLGS
jgi:tetratricopeptide (TPR) repeat protein